MKFNRNMIDYLFYKLFRASQRSSIPEGAGLIANIIFTVLIFLNVFTVWGLMKKAEIVTLNLFPNKETVIAVMVGIFILSALLFFIKGRYKKIIERFEKENSSQRVRGNIIVIVYIVITFIITLLGPLYKPGIL